MKSVLKLLALGLLILAAVVVYRGLSLRAPETRVPDPVQVEVPPGAVDRFAGAVRFPTLTQADTSLFDPAPFKAFREYLRESFPRVHEGLSPELVGGNSLLFTWAGSNPELPPVILMAHYDVVPVEPGTEGEWVRPPFSGVVVDGEVWGRGTMDDKASLMALLEGVETLLARGFEPERTLLLAFGHDEEVGGTRGAAEVAALLEKRGVSAAYVLDEGLAIVEGALPGVDVPVALLGLAEKGYLSLQLTVDGEGGHSSTPTAESSVGILAGAVSRLEAHPMEARLDGPTRMLLETLGPRTSFGMRIVAGNLWLFRGLVARLMAGSPETNAAVRTTTAPTLFHAGVKDNVLPRQAVAVVNFRLLPGDTKETVLAHVEQVVGDPRVQVEVYQGMSVPPSPVSRVEAPGYRQIGQAVQEVFPGTLVAPFLTLGGTDSKHFAGIAEDVYRFAPLRYAPELAAGVHGTNERIPVDDYRDMIRFYIRLMEIAGGE